MRGTIGHSGRVALIGATIVLGGLAPRPGQAQDQTSWSWNKALASGKTIEIKGVNGEVRALPASGREVVVTAQKHASRSDVDDVRIQVVEHADGVTICAVYPTPRKAERENECRPGGRGQMNVNNNDVKVDFTVRVPAGHPLIARTVNGRIEISELTDDVEAYTVNGGIEIATRGEAMAQTVNGSIRAELGSIRGSEPLEFKTVNGSITLDVPSSLDADVDFRVVNGDIETDFPVTVNGRFGRRSMKGVIGSGGREISAQTVNGSIRLRKNRALNGS